MIKGTDIIDPKDIPTMMPSMAASYDLGPPLIVNGRLWSDKWSDAYSHRITCELRHSAEGIDRWCITDGFQCLTKGGRWTRSLNGSRQNKQFINQTRWLTAQEAIVAYFNWKAVMLAKVNRKLAKDPNAILNY